MESGGHGRGERVTAMDHQGYQESHRTRGNDEALGGKGSVQVCRAPWAWGAPSLPFVVPFASQRRRLMYLSRRYHPFPLSDYITYGTNAT